MWTVVEIFLCDYDLGVWRVRVVSIKLGYTMSQGASHAVECYLSTLETGYLWWVNGYGRWTLGVSQYGWSPETRCYGGTLKWINPDEDTWLGQSLRTY